MSPIREGPNLHGVLRQPPPGHPLSGGFLLPRLFLNENSKTTRPIPRPRHFARSRADPRECGERLPQRSSRRRRAQTALWFPQSRSRAERFHQHMNVVGHHSPGAQFIVLPMIISESTVNYCGNLGISQRTSSAPFAKTSSTGCAGPQSACRP